MARCQAMLDALPTFLWPCGSDNDDGQAVLAHFSLVTAILGHMTTWLQASAALSWPSAVLLTLTPCGLEAVGQA